MPAAPNNQYAKIWTDEEIEKLGEEFIKWAKESEDIFIGGFALDHDKSPQWLNYLADNYPKFAQAKEKAMRWMARKILKHSFYDKSVNAYVGMQYISIYDPDYKDLIKWKAEIQKESQSKENNKCIFNDTLKELKADDNNPG